MQPQWTSGNELELLENGEEYFPKLFDAIDAAKEEIIVEVYIWFEDDIGLELGDRLEAAARRGVEVLVTVDGFASRNLSVALIRRLTDAGVEMRVFDAFRASRVLTSAFCRLHRKIAVIDGETAFVGGINIWQLHLRRYGDESMQDYAVRARGPVAAAVRDDTLDGATMSAPSRLRRWREKLRRAPRAEQQEGTHGRAAFVRRDNRDHPNAIEAMYRSGIRAATDSILIANAYFIPGYRFLHGLRRAARRGVDVRVILQGKPDVAVSALAESLLHNYLLAANVKIFRYMERPLHAKVAVIDDAWVTVGSSNLDPTGLGLNIESNLFAQDEGLARDLRASLTRLIEESCLEVTSEAPSGSWFRRLLLLFFYHATRHMSRWGSMVLWRRQRTRPLCP